MQQIQQETGAALRQKEFEQFVVVFAVLGGRRVSFHDVTWDEKEQVWTYDNLEEKDNSRDNSSRSAGTLSDSPPDSSLDASAIHSSDALTIGKRSSADSSAANSSRAPSSTVPDSSQQEQQKQQVVELTLPAPQGDATSEPLVMRNIVFDWKPEAGRHSHLRRLSAIDDAALVTFWKTYNEEFLDKPELDFERSAIKALSARRKKCSVTSASYELHHHLVYLLETYSNILNHARAQGGAVLDPDVFTDFSSVFTALGGRDVVFKSVSWNEKKNIWEENEVDQEMAPDDSTSVEKPSEDETATAAGQLPPRKRRCSANGSNGDPNPAGPGNDGSGKDKAGTPTAEDLEHRDKRRRLNENEKGERSRDGPSSGDDKSYTRAIDRKEEGTNKDLDQDIAHGKLDDQQREQKSRLHREQAADNQAEHDRRIEMLRELCKSALALHSIGMCTEAETVMDRFIALVDRN